MTTNSEDDLSTAAQKATFFAPPTEKNAGNIITRWAISFMRGVFLLCYFADCESRTQMAAAELIGRTPLRNQTNRLWERPLTFIKTKMVCNQLGRNDTHWWPLDSYTTAYFLQKHSQTDTILLCKSKKWPFWIFSSYFPGFNSSSAKMSLTCKLKPKVN